MVERVGEYRVALRCAVRGPACDCLSCTAVHAVEDLIVKDDASRGGKHVAGAVTNWTLVSLNHDTQMCM